MDSGRVRAGESGKVTSGSGKVGSASGVVEAPTEYKSAMTRKAWMLSLAPTVVSLVLIHEGIHTNGQFAPSDYSRLPFVLIPMGLGLTILLTMIIGTIKVLKYRVVVSRKELIYDAGHEDHNFSTPWATLAYSPPHPGKKLIRSLLLSDGRKYAQVYDIFTPEFDKLVTDIEKRKGQMSLGSGRMKMESGRINV